MHRAFRWFLYTVLVLVAAIWLTLGLLKPEHLKGPFVAWVQQQTGLPLEIGKLNYNPLFPNVVLAENVTLGPDLKADKVYLEIASGSWWQRRLHIVHLDIIHPQIKWQPGLNLPQPLRQLQIDDLTIDKMKLSWNNGSLEGGSLHLTNWQPIRDGEVLPFADVKFDASVDRLQLDALLLGRTRAQGTQSGRIVTINNLESDLFHGGMAAKLSWDLNRNQLDFQELALANWQLDLQTLPIASVVFPHITAEEVTLENISVIDLSKHFALNQATGTVEKLAWLPGQWPTFEYQGKLGEFTDGLFQLTDMQGEGRLREQDWRLQLEGSAYAGQFNADLEGNRQPATLTINDLQLNNMQPELHPGWHEWLAAQPFQQIDLRRLDVSHFSLISFDDSVPLTMKWLDLFLTDLRWTPQGWQNSNHKARLEGSWLELVWQTLVSRKAEFQAEMADNAVQLKQFTTQLEESALNASGQWGLNADSPHQLKLSLNNFDLEQLSDMWGPRYPFAGQANLTVDLQAQGQDWNGIKSSLKGAATLDIQDLFVNGLTLDAYLDALLTPKAPPTQDFGQMIGKLRGGDSAFNHVRISLQADKGQLDFSSSAFESITHLIGVKQGLDLSKNSWQLQLGLLNDQNQPELLGSLSGDLTTPKLQFRLPPNNASKWATQPIHYPPQGKEGALRE
ncbi:MAG: AsmA-like C-terminal region-containing protein [Tolumonas sp.]|nr:AsmA-like C-terminal region-containing protein [Tolumonas sp.]